MKPKRRTEPVGRLIRSTAASVPLEWTHRWSSPSLSALIRFASEHRRGVRNICLIGSSRLYRACLCSKSLTCNVRSGHGGPRRNSLSCITSKQLWATVFPAVRQRASALCLRVGDPALVLPDELSSPFHRGHLGGSRSRFHCPCFLSLSQPNSNSSKAERERERDWRWKAGQRELFTACLTYSSCLCQWQP